MEPERKLELVWRVLRGELIKDVAAELSIKYSNAKSIMSTYRRKSIKGISESRRPRMKRIFIVQKVRQVDRKKAAEGLKTGRKKAKPSLQALFGRPETCLKVCIDLKGEC